MPADTRTSASPALAASLRVAVARLSRRLRTERLVGAEVSLGQLGVLARLSCDGDLSSGALAQSEGVKPPSMTRTIAGLEALGMVERSAHPTDRRQVVVSITERGEETLQADRRRREHWLAKALGELTADERAILAAAAPLLEKLSGSRP